jgi:hypothetical protein
MRNVANLRTSKWLGGNSPSGDGRMSNSSIAESIHEDRKNLSSQDRWIKLATLILVCASIFMLPLDYTIVAVALHDIQLDLKASFVDLQWFVNGYTLTFAAFLLAGGTLADLFGRRRLYIRVWSSSC